MTFSNIGLQEPSTITARVATVTIPRGSTNEQQEIMVVGDPTSSLGVARVLGADPASTEFGLVVRQVGFVAPSTTVQVSSLAGRVQVAPSDTAWASSAGFHFNSSGDLKVEVSAYSTTVSVANTVAVTLAAYSTTAQVSSLAGRVTVAPTDTNWASSAGFHFTSSGELQVAGTFSASTTVQVSSLAGRVTVAPTDTNWASSAGFHFTSSGELQVNASFSGSTTVNVSSLAGRVTTAPTDTNWASSAGFHFTSSGELIISPVSISGFSTQVAVSSVAGRVTTAPSDTNWASSAGFHFNSSGELLTVAAVTTSTTVNVSSLAGRVAVAPNDTNWASSAGFHFTSSGELQVSGTFSASTIVFVSNLPVTLSTAAPATGDTGVIVRQVGFVPFSTTVSVANSITVGTMPAGSTTITINAFAAGLISSAVSAGNSSALLVRVVGGASSAGDFVGAVQPIAGSTWRVNPGDTNWASSAGFHFNSSGDLKVELTAASTTVTVNGFAAGYVSTVAPSSNSSGLIVRPVVDNLLTVASTNLFVSSLFAVNSTATGQKCKVYAYSITSTVGTATKVAFYDGSSVIWPIMLAALSSGVTGVNLAVTPPAYLFAATAGSSVTLRTPSSIAGFKAAISYFMAP